MHIIKEKLHVNVQGTWFIVTYSKIQSVMFLYCIVRTVCRQPAVKDAHVDRQCQNAKGHAKQKLARLHGSIQNNNYALIWFYKAAVQKKKTCSCKIRLR